MGALHNNLGLVLSGLDELAGARIQYERALAICQATLGPDHPDMATVHGNLGTVLLSLGDLDGARTHFGLAVVARLRNLVRRSSDILQQDGGE